MVATIILDMIMRWVYPCLAIGNLGLLSNLLKLFLEECGCWCSEGTNGIFGQTAILPS